MIVILKTVYTKIMPGYIIKYVINWRCLEESILTGPPANIMKYVIDWRCLEESILTGPDYNERLMMFNNISRLKKCISMTVFYNGSKLRNILFYGFGF